MAKERNKVLIIDDDQGLIRILEKRLMAQNFDVVGALNGETGYRAACQQLPDVILLDVMMPDLSGAEVAKKLINNPQTKDIPIIFITVTISKKQDKIPKELEVDGRAFPAFAKPLYFPKTDCLNSIF